MSFAIASPRITRTCAIGAAIFRDRYDVIR